MSDNTTLPGTGAVVATDDISNVAFQRVKVTLGADGVNDGDVASGNPLPVSLASTPLPTGASTAAGQTANGLLTGAVDETAPATDTADSGLNGRLQRIAQRITSLLALLPASLGQKVKASSLAVTLASDQDALPITDNSGSLTVDGTFWQATQPVSAASLPLPSGAATAAKQPAVGTAGTASADVLTVQGVAGMTPLAATGYGFDATVTPGVTNGAYSANDIMGALMTFTVARAIDEAIILNELQFSFKSAVTPSLLAVLFEADPTGTTKTDNAAYSLAAADVAKVRAALPVNSLNGYLTDHGTPNTIRLPNLNLVMKPATGTRDIYLLLIDLTGVTLTSTSDLQVRACGVGV